MRWLTLYHITVLEFMAITNLLLQYHQSVVDNARKAAKAQEGRPLAVALDTVPTN